MIDWTRKPVAALIRHMDQHTSQAAETLFARHGGSRPIYFILLALHEKDRTTQRELAAVVDLREATLSEHLRVMAERDLITRYRPPENQRTQQIALTERGTELFTTLRTAIEDFDAHVRAAAGTEADLALLYEMGPRIAAAADEYIGRTTGN
ncbi:MarR family winged helix-turn-helix transcriptional regulator [Brachybacterium sp. GCM10030267]|uniref:MarR family winged helix-turn-helix transcriptional regulator n=1 Tax=unclassified Brachybacterium TaxID=2623841 RepID=UPI003611C2DB